MPERNRGRGLLFCAVLVVALLPAGVGAAPDTGNADYDKAAGTIMCDCGCHPQSVHDCACSRAEDMRREISAAVQSGKTGDQVIADYVARSGETARIVPTTHGFNLLAWLGPGAGFFGALAFVVLVLYRWKRRSRPAEEAPIGGSAVEDPYLKRLDRELEEYR